MVLMAASTLAAGGFAAVVQTPSPANKKFGDGTVACRYLKTDIPKRCVPFPNINLRPTSKRILSVSIARAANHNSHMTIASAPLGILLPAGLTLLVGEKEPVRFPLHLFSVGVGQRQFPVGPNVRRGF